MDCDEPIIKKTISTHSDSVYTVCFSPDQTKLCSGSKKLILTNLQNYETQKVLTGNRGRVKGSEFSSNGVVLVTVSTDKTCRIWKVESEDCNSTRLRGHSSFVNCVRFFRNDPTKFISGSRDTTIKIWDIERKKEISTLKGLGKNFGEVYSVDILPDNQTIASGDGNACLKIWDFRSGKCVKTLNQHKELVKVIRFHPNTFSLASGSWDKTAKIFDFRTFQVVQDYKHSNSVISVCFHPSGKFLVAGSKLKILVFDLLKKKILSTLKGPKSWVRCVQFSPDGRSFASVSANKVLLWNFPLGRMSLDIDEDERVKYLIHHDLVDVVKDNFCGRNVLELRIDNFCTLYSYKFLFC